MSKAKILVQLDTDQQPSLFDSIVAIDAGVENLLRYHGVNPHNVTELVHGAIFTRGADDLWRTAMFLGGSDVKVAESVLSQIRETFFGPLRVSVMVDPAGSNTTAAAAVLAAGRHVPLEGATAIVLAATGPVGQRVVRLLAREGALVKVASRNLQRAEALCEAIRGTVPEAQLSACAPHDGAQLEQALEGVQVVIAAGAPGVELLPAEVRERAKSLQVVIDLNAVPPAGLEGVEVIDRGTDRSGVKCYGAIGVGVTKMRIHKAALQLIFETNDRVLDIDELFELGRGV
ncbi:MAG TPA: methylene-tetrahydromethanopterin dehydrogenase N-terminal domain-containing protein [Pirellulales bacterium]|jgi:hypothetical protein|nr:methylene-tetrahydromethanopterin dehydrogenase N-terminal domain-containing protein [Pirellulales bacterium]